MLDMHPRHMPMRVGGKSGEATTCRQGVAGLRRCRRLGREARVTRVCAGGWKMKLALARAMLLEAGLLLLDEPTNHMDVSNVQWLQQYLLSCGTTLITVSHDSGFLDTVCTGIIHYENKKLAKYRGNLSAFVQQKPEAKAYYELTDEFVKFKFPTPGPLDGVRCAPCPRAPRTSDSCGQPAAMLF